MIDIKLKGVDKALERLTTIPKGVQKAANTAINRTAISARAISSREIVKHYNVKVTDVKRTMIVKRSSRKSLEAEIISKGGVIALSKYKVTPKVVQHKGNKNKPLRVAVKKGSGQKIIRGAFMAQFKSGHLGVVRRRGEKRFPVQELYGPSIPQMFKNEAVVAPVKKLVEDRLEKEFNHEAMRVIGGGKK